MNSKPIGYDPLRDTLFARMPQIVVINYHEWSPEVLKQSVERLSYEQAIYLWNRTQFCNAPRNPYEMRLYCMFVEPAVLALHQLLLRRIRGLNPQDTWTEETHRLLMEYQHFHLFRWGANLYGLYRGEMLFIQERRSKKLFVNVTEVPNLGGIFTKIGENWPEPPPLFGSGKLGRGSYG